MEENASERRRSSNSFQIKTLSDFKSFKELVQSLSNCWWTQVAEAPGDLWHADNKVLAY